MISVPSIPRRVLWFTNIPMPAMLRRVNQRVSGSGHWMIALLERLRAVKSIKVGVVAAVPGLANMTFTEGGIDYFVLSQPRYFANDVDPAMLQRCAEIATRWDPDLLHVHGTERIYGLLGARDLVACDSLVSLQGLLTAIVPKFYGSLSLSGVVRSHRVVEVLTKRGLLWQRRDFARRSELEAEILKGNRHFTGQTDWDRAHLLLRNPEASYYRVDRILRSEFYGPGWTPKSHIPHSIIFTNAGSPLRDVETLLDAVKSLTAVYPDVTLRLAGVLDPRRGYARHLIGRISALGLQDRVQLLGYLDAEQLVQALRASHVYAICSHIENESNSLCEAMLTGLPCVASYAGGMPTTAVPEESALFFPVGDAAMLAYQIRRIFDDSDLASGLGSAARATAQHRHDPARVLRQLLDAYQRVDRNGGHDETSPMPVSMEARA